MTWTRDGMKVGWVAVAMLLVWGRAASAQATTVEAGAGAKVPVYDVMTVKRNKTLGGGVDISIDNGTYAATNVSLKRLLEEVYDVKEDLISGVKGELASARFDVAAKVVEPNREAMAKMTPQQERLMLLPLLTERFGLKVHTETKVLPVYELVVGPGGPKFQPTPGAKSGDDNISVHTRSLDAQGLPMTGLAKTLADVVHRTVLDRTGLTGFYTLQLKWSSDEVTDLPADAPPTIFTAVEEQLGLKLRAAKGPVETLVVDGARMPTEN